MDNQVPVIKIGSTFRLEKSEVVVTQIHREGVEITIDGRTYGDLIPFSTFDSCTTT